MRLFVEVAFENLYLHVIRLFFYILPRGFKEEKYFQTEATSSRHLPNRLVSNYAQLISNQESEAQVEGNNTKENSNYSSDTRLSSFVGISKK